MTHELQEKSSNFYRKKRVRKQHIQGWGVFLWSRCRVRAAVARRSCSVPGASTWLNTPAHCGSSILPMRWEGALCSAVYDFFILAKQGFGTIFVRKVRKVPAHVQACVLALSFCRTMMPKIAVWFFSPFCSVHICNHCFWNALGFNPSTSFYWVVKNKCYCNLLRDGPKKFR